MYFSKAQEVPTVRLYNIFTGKHLTKKETEEMFYSLMHTLDDDGFIHFSDDYIWDWFAPKEEEMRDTKLNTDLRFSYIDILKAINSVPRHRNKKDEGMVEGAFGEWLTYTQMIGALHKLDEDKLNVE